MVLNIGGRSTNLLFVDRARFFARTIPIAGHTITQQVAKEFGIGFAEAEELKRRHGFVALGGAYAEPESEVAANVSKIIRNVMARLHGEINRSISVYRAQQHGNRPARMVLTGGSSTLTYCDHFFAEKLHMEVSYFNPFQVVSLGPAVDRQRLQEVAHMFSEVIGLGLRYRLPCPIEVTLVPETIRRQQALRRKKPFVYAAMACFLVILMVAWFAQLNRGRAYSGAADRVQGLRQGVEGLATKIRGYRNDSDQRKSQVASIVKLLEERRRWPDVYNEIYRLKPDNLWFHSVQPVLGEIKPAKAAAATSGRGAGGMLDGGTMMPGGFPGGGGTMGTGGGGGGMMGPPAGGMMGPPAGGMTGGGGGGGGGAEPVDSGGAEGGGFPGGGGGGGMMGGGGGGGMMGGGTGTMAGGQSEATATPQTISGLIISGHGVLLGATDATEAIRRAAEDVRGKEEAPGGAAPEGAEAPAQGEEKPAAPAEEEAKPPAEGEAAATTPADETPEQRLAKARQRAAKQATPEQAFLELVRASTLFDPDEEFTAIVSYTMPVNIDNLSTFTIQVKFKEPFEFSQFGR
jgi:uncharacterized membrane protein YgcG